MERSWGQASLYLLNGAAVVGVVHGLTQLPQGIPHCFGQGLILHFSGTMLVASLAWLLWWGAAKVLGKPAPQPGTAFWVGWGLALMPLAASFLPHLPVLPQSPALGILVGLPVLAAAPLLARRFTPPFAWIRWLLPALAILCPLFLTLDRRGGAWHPGPYDLPEQPPESQSAETVGGQRPDLILISLDTLRADAVVGPNRAEVPVLDRLRQEGLWASYARASSNQTLPSHIGMLTGLDAMAFGVRSNYEALPSELALLSELLLDGGYRTFGVVTNGFIRGDAGFARGFEVYDDSAVALTGRRKAFQAMADDYSWFGWIVPSAWLDSLLQHPFVWGVPRVDKNLGGRGAGRRTTDRTLHALDQLQQQDRPYFLFSHFIDPHAPYGAPGVFRGSRTADLPLPAEEYRHSRPQGPVQQQHILAAEAGLRAGSEEAAEAVRFMHQLYLEEVSFLDACMGEIVAKVEASGRPTVILITGDHGEHFGEHNLMRHSNSVFEPLLQVPFFMWGHEVPAKQIDPPFLMDVAPTLLHLAGLESEGMAGRALLAPGEGGASRPHVARDDKRVAVVFEGWKWTARWTGGEEAPEATGLYDLKTDPQEQNNLLGEVDVPSALQDAISKLLARDTSASRRSGLAAEQRVFLEEMGYADEEDHEEGQE
ncbi:MAG: hypothetical protein DWQ01_15000 [Planctomycetota bacterium]|nr:MAG: hypothetical protein DWQ01_15000 [Planctomycetota bacterium]